MDFIVVFSHSPRPRNAHKFASKLFEKQQRFGSPSFSAETAFKYFQETYTDVERDFIYTAPEGMQHPNPPILFSLYDAQLMLKFAKASDGRETVHHLVLMLLLMYHIRNANLSKSLLLNLLGKSGGKKIFLLTGLRHLLCCCLNLKIWLQFQNFAPLQLLAQLEKSFSL